MKEKSIKVHPQKVLPINRVDIRFVVRSVTVDLGLYRNRNVFRKQHAVIAVKNYQNRKEILHPLTQFIFYRWKGKSYNTQRSHAKNVTTFLNFALIENRLKFKLSSLSELKLEHGTNFLNHLTLKGRTRDTVKSAERTLTEFYLYLSSNDLINIPVEQFQKAPMHYDRRKKYVLSPFSGVIYPSKKTGSSVAHMIPEEFILPFLELAVKVANPIALGVYMQCFGGIRIGGLVNIKKSNITSVGSYGEYGLIVNLKKQNMREDLLDSAGANYVKKERKQLVFPIKDWLKVLYQNHLGNYSASDDSDALFINRDGKAMTGRTYRDYFSKLKNEFLKQLRESSNPTDKMWAIKLETLKWSTHIGRGIFTNLLSEEATNPYDIALPRGDSSLASAMVYQGNTKRMKDNLEKRMDELYKGFLPQLTRR